jgi:hypothetical protein
MFVVAKLIADAQKLKRSSAAAAGWKVSGGHFGNPNPQSPSNFAKHRQASPRVTAVRRSV